MGVVARPGILDLNEVNCGTDQDVALMETGQQACEIREARTRRRLAGGVPAYRVRLMISFMISDVPP